MEILKKKKPTKTSKPITAETAEQLKTVASEFLTEEEGLLLIRALKSNLARPQAIENLKKYQSFF